MLLQRQNNHSNTSYPASAQILTDAKMAEHTEQSSFELRIGAHLDPGIRRKQRPNEDTVIVTHGVMPSTCSSPKSFVLLAVADGMGGPGHGQQASQLAVKSLAKYVSGFLSCERTPEAFLPLLTEGVQYANQAVYGRNQQQHTVMGTTITAILVIETTAYVAHVGDSRLYLYRKPIGLVQVTRDHSIVALLVDEGIIAPDDIYTHPNRNQIYRSVGNEANVEVDTLIVPLSAEDILLLCSDGLWEMVRNQQIAAIVSTPMPTLDDMAHALIQAALAGGGEDNVSAIVAQVSNVR
jgi:serine/threonine protein phosphatase PrpC